MEPINWALDQMPGSTLARLVLVQMAAEVEPPRLPVLAGPPWTYNASPYRLARLAAQCSVDEAWLRVALSALGELGLIRTESGPSGPVFVLGLYADRRVVAASVRNGYPVPVALRREVLERDGNACVECGDTEDVHIDHRYPRWLGGLNVLANLQALCTRHNMAKGMAEA